MFMQPSKKKPFINKKEAVTFHLVHRSQQDPLQADEEASKHVLVHQKDKVDTEKRKEEQREYGVFYEDDYNYMQHLREANEVYSLEEQPSSSNYMGSDTASQSGEQGPALTLPASVFESQFEKPVGLLNEAVPVRGPQPSWDPDIVEALDDDFDFDNPDNALEDDFIAAANQPAGEGQDLNDDSDLASVSDIASDEAAMSGSDDFDTDFKYGDRGFMDEETKSHFTEYSMSSSVIRRNQGLTMLDDRFEKLYEEYDDSELGALDHEDIDGSIQQNSQVLNKLLEDFEQQQQITKLADVVDEKVGDDDVDLVSEESDSDTEMVKMEMKPEEKWDCESILSTYSNLYNHPKLITEPKKEFRVKGRHGLPEESIAHRGLSQQQVDDELMGRERSDKASTYRPKGETTEERNERKKAIKLERQERRQEKKMNKKAFTAEKVRQDRDSVNLKNTLNTVKIV